MICKSCGGEYAAEALACPYCGTENETAAAKHKEEILYTYDREAGKIRKQAEAFPERAGRRLTKYILLGAGCLLAICVAAAVIFILAGRIGSNLSYRSGQVHRSNLEALFQDREYAAIAGYLRENDLWGRDYEKYRQVADVYEDRLRMDEMTEEIRQIAAENYSAEQKEELCAYWMETFLECASEALQDCDTYTGDNVFLQNEEALLALSEECISYLSGLGFSGEDIRVLREWDGESVPEALMQRLRSYYL